MVRFFLSPTTSFANPPPLAGTYYTLIFGGCGTQETRYQGFAPPRKLASGELPF
jgi:hypothetical protein